MSTHGTVTMDLSFFSNLEINNLKIIKDYPILQALCVFLIYLVLAKLVDLVIDKMLKRLARLTKVSFDDQLIGFIHSPLCWTIPFLGVLHGLIYLRLNPPWNTVIPCLVKSMILLVWWIAIIRLINWLADQSFAMVYKTGKIGRDLFYLFKNVIRVVAIVVGVLWLLNIWHVNLTPLFASAGIAGIAVALAAKDTLANFFGGISIFIDKSFNVGDYIILDSGERGEVVDIGIRSTRIKTRDDILITIPNSILANAKIINESAPIPRFRIRVPVGVAYGVNLRLVEKILVNVAKSNSLVASDPVPRARLRAFADSSINFELLCWVNDPREKGLALHQLFNEIYDAFEKHDISIPFPQRDVHLFYPQGHPQLSLAQGQMNNEKEK